MTLPPVYTPVLVDSTRIEHDNFLAAIYPNEILRSEPARTTFNKFHVTLTYAQSLDGKIAGLNGKQIILSGKESMTFTHRLREVNDYCLVGIGTVLNDDPQLTARQPVMLPLALQPIPIVIDSQLRIPLTCKLIQNFKNGIGHAPIVFHHSTASAEKLLALKASGVECYGSSDPNGRVFLQQLVDTLSARDLCRRSLMVEGGASIITSFLNSKLIDLLIITIAPLFVGEGVGIVTTDISLPKMNHLVSQNFGQDVIVVCQPRN